MHYLIFLSILMILTGCIKPDPEPEYFTWEGTLYKGMSDEPLANTALYLHSVIKPNLSYAVKQEIIASTTTDANGKFKLIYPRINSQFEEWRNNEEGLYLEKGPLSSTTTNYIVKQYPWNINIKKDFAESNHSRVVVDVTINSDSLPDSLYYELIDPVSDIYSRNFYFPNHNVTRKIFVIPVPSKHFTMKHKSSWGADGWENKPGTKFYFSYGINEQDFLLANSNEPNVPSTYNTIPYQLRGFPKVDTIKIIIP